PVILTMNQRLSPVNPYQTRLLGSDRIINTLVCRILKDFCLVTFAMEVKSDHEFPSHLKRFYLFLAKRVPYIKYGYLFYGIQIASLASSARGRICHNLKRASHG